MTHSLKSLDKDGVLPKKIDTFDMPKNFDSLSKFKWNEAISSIEEIGIEIDKKEINKIIIESMQWNQEIYSLTTDGYLCVVTNFKKGEPQTFTRIKIDQSGLSEAIAENLNILKIVRIK